MSVDEGSASKEIADLQKRLADLDRERENVLGALEIEGTDRRRSAVDSSKGGSHCESDSSV